MKNRHLICLSLLLALLLSFAGLLPVSAGSLSAEDDSGIFYRGELPGDVSSVIAVASDLHIDPGAKARGEINPFVIYNRELTRALLSDVRHIGAEYLILSGDITNAGREAQHEELRGLLQDAEEQGLRIFVINGNHDIGQVDPARFAEIFADFGYNEAFSRDSASLSYSILLPDRMLILVDTGGYYNRGLSGDISPETISWISSQLKYADANALPVLTVGHYPIVAAKSADFPGVEEFRALLLKHKVPLYVCGHAHGRSVRLDRTLTELVVEQTISYSCSYALITCYESGELMYRGQTIDVPLWASTASGSDSVFTGFDSFRESEFNERCSDLVTILKGDRPMFSKTVKYATEFYHDFSLSSTHGRLYYDIEALRQHRGYKAFMEVAKGSNYEPWIKVVMENPLPYSAGFIIKDGTALAIEPAE